MVVSRDDKKGQRARETAANARVVSSGSGIINDCRQRLQRLTGPGCLHVGAYVMPNVVTNLRHTELATAQTHTPALRFYEAPIATTWRVVKT